MPGTFFRLIVYTQYRIEESDSVDGIPASILNNSLYEFQIFSSVDRCLTDKLSTLSRELYPAAEKLYTTADILHTTAEKLYTTAGILHTTAEKLYITAGILHTTAEKLYTTAGILHTTAEKLYTTAGILHTTAKKLYTSASILYTSAIIKRSSNNVYFMSPFKYYFALSHKIKKYNGGKNEDLKEKNGKHFVRCKSCY